MNKSETAIRSLSRKGYRLAKSRVRNNEDMTFGRYRIEDPHTNTVIAGAFQRAFELTLDETSEAADHMEKNWRA